jgi:preprotein translocase subunit Sec63
LDSDLAASNWDPWTSLNLTAPMLDVRSSFNTREVKKAYRNMAKIYHPDKVANMKLNQTIAE